MTPWSTRSNSISRKRRSTATRRRVDSRFGLVYFPQRWRLDGIGGRLSPAANA